MPISTLAFLALKQIPSSSIPHMSLKERTSVHYVLYSHEVFPHIFFPRGYKNLTLRNICDCINFGRCLCYLELIRHVRIDQYWGDAADFETLSAWLKE